jgi:hypothetical protein
LRRSTLVSISAAAIVGVAALVVVLVVVLSGGGGKGPAAHRSASAPHARAKHATPHVRKTKTSHVAQSHKVKQVAHPARPSRVHLPKHRRVRLLRWKWHPNKERAIVAATRVRSLAVYHLPRARKPAVRLSKFDSTGTRRVLLVRETRPPNWVRVYLPLRPNGSKGWVPARAVKLLWNPWRIVIRLRAHRMYVFRGRRLFLHAKVVVGKPSTPTPVGTYFIVNLLKPPDPNADYGPFTYDLSAHSYVLKTFAGGDGHVAIHGTNAPWLLGQSVSHGCIRVSNAVIRRLAHVLPLGTPVLIKR